MPGWVEDEETVAHVFLDTVSSKIDVDVSAEVINYAQFCDSLVFLSAAGDR